MVYVHNIEDDDRVMSIRILSDGKTVDSSEAQKTDTTDLWDIEDSNIATCALWVFSKQARTAMNNLPSFIERARNSEEQAFSALFNLEDNAIIIEQPNY